MIATASPLWFARHECRIAWREWIGWMTAGKPGRARTVALALIVFAAFLHLLAFGLIANAGDIAGTPDTATLMVVTGSGGLGLMLMLSQAMESVTRAFYARADLDLILASPAPARTLFALRIGAIAATTTGLAVLLTGPFIDVLALRGGAHWLAGYGVVVAMGSVASGLAVALTVAMFRLIGPKRTRLIAQIVAAVVGAGFVIGVQIGSILSLGQMSRFALFRSQAALDWAPGPDSPLWWPARAVMGDVGALAIVLVIGFAVLGVAIVLVAPGFGDHAVAAAGIGGAETRQRRGGFAFRAGSAAQALRTKEWKLLRRDPWLLSQTLMQILYLLPPALLLWRNFGDGNGALIVIVPVIVMAAGQLAGGLAWLAISGEDAPDLVATAPVAGRAVTRAKIEAVLMAVMAILAPLVAAMSLIAAETALVALAFIALSAGSAAAIQLCFRAQAKRSQFRRRQTSSRIATFAEAFASISWAGAAGLAASGSWLALAGALIALSIVAAAWRLGPTRTAA